MAARQNFFNADCRQDRSDVNAGLLCVFEISTKDGVCFCIAKDRLFYPFKTPLAEVRALDCPHGAGGIDALKGMKPSKKRFSAVIMPP